MALMKTIVLFLALLNGVLFLQAVVADDIAAPKATTHMVESKSSSGVTISEDGYWQDDESLGSIRAEDTDFNVDLLPNHGVIDEEDADLSDANMSSEVDGEGEGEEEALSPAHPLARILTSRSSKTCSRTKSCQKFFKKPGCCKKKCVNLAGDNNNCGKCGIRCKSGSTCKSSKCVKSIPTSSQCGHTKCKPNQTCCQNKCVSLSTDSKNCGHCGRACDQKKGFVCKSGQCVKPSPTPSECGLHKKCKNGNTCCLDKCVDLKGNNGHCGKCNKGCGFGSACCKGTCKSIKNDNRNCGACGNSCGFAKKCCYGYCVDVFGRDKNNCGACGKKCTTTCKFGMCGYGH